MLKQIFLTRTIEVSKMWPLGTSTQIASVVSRRTGAALVDNFATCAVATSLYTGAYSCKILFIIYF